MFRVVGISGGYGHGPVLNGIDMEAAPGTITAILGRNGMGKSTLVTGIMGALPVVNRQVFLGDRDMTAVPTHELAKNGVSVVPEDRGVLPSLSVHENMELAARNAGQKRSEIDFESEYERFPDLRRFVKTSAGNLSGGQQEMLALARALITKPDVLLLDEPTHGLSPLLAKMVMDVLFDLRQTGVVTLLIEQSVALALPVADHVYVIVKGEVVFRGTGESVRAQPSLVERYLHVGEADSV